GQPRDRGRRHPRGVQALGVGGGAATVCADLDHDGEVVMDWHLAPRPDLPTGDDLRWQRWMKCRRCGVTWLQVLDRAASHPPSCV
ncbi:MAG TPA: hypothetical protein VGC77_21500, partial [Rhodopseudomonas sp.]|uniref:hypothetical protein n=1 Tax=Rhodopseudomonas sp. TaxID=1078 RepID=UPI002ED90C58